MIEINLLGRFEFFVGGKDLCPLLSSMRKGKQMLLYLILSYGKPVSSQDLYDALWPGESSANPESALKTMVSRLRSSLNEFDPSLAKAIKTGHGTYSWNTQLDAHLDIVEFEGICKRIANLTTADEELDRQVSSLLAYYNGDLYVGKDEFGFFLSRRADYHAMYINAIENAVRLYKNAENLDAIIHLCRSAIDLDAFAENLHIELMVALVKSGRSNEALSQYRHMSNLHYSYMGVSPTQSMQDFYDSIARTADTLESDAAVICRNLTDDDERSGAYVCDYAILKDIYQMQMRNLRRLGTSMYLAVIMLAPAGQVKTSPLELDKCMHQLLSVMTLCLRKGDTIARYSPSQFVVLLPTVNSVTGRAVIKRIRSAYYSRYVNPDLVFSYQLTPLSVSDDDD